MIPAKTIPQYYAFLACNIGSLDDEIDGEMVAICREMKLPSVELYGRLIGIEVDNCTEDVPQSCMLVLTIQAHSVVQVLKLDLSEHFVQALVRKLDMFDPARELSINLWGPPASPGAIDYSDDHFAAVRQGRWLFDAYVGDPWTPAEGESTDDFDDPAYATQFVCNALSPCTLDWHRELVARLADRIHAATMTGVRPGRASTQDEEHYPFDLGPY